MTTITDPHLTTPSILAICLLLALVWVAINKLSNKRFTRKEIITGVGMAVISTLLSLLIKYQTISGTIEQNFRGWPHRYLSEHLREIVDNTELHKVIFDGSYIPINIAFYTCVFLLITALKKAAKESH